MVVNGTAEWKQVVLFQQGGRKGLSRLVLVSRAGVGGDLAGTGEKRVDDALHS